MRKQYVSMNAYSSETYRQEGFYSGSISCSPQEAWARVLCADHRCFAQPLSKPPFCARHTANIIESWIFGQDWSLDIRYRNPYRTSGTGWGREGLGREISEKIHLITPSYSLFITENGYLGLAKDDDLFAKDDEGGLRAGDSIFILSEGNMPFVLREEKSLQKSQSHGDKLWKIFNPCHVHGFMDGEHNERLLKEQGGCTTLKIV